MVAGAVALGACAQSGYDATKLQSQLEHAGVSAAQARCVTDKMENTFDVNQLASHSEPTAQEEATTRAVLRACGVTLPPG
jgi:hypothetical protein